MKYFHCKACGKDFKHEVKSCPDCGSTSIGQITYRVQFELTGMKYPYSAHKTMVLGKNHFRLYGPGYQSLSQEQFRLVKNDNDWQIIGLPARNPTLLNGKDITNQTEVLKSGDIVKIGLFQVTITFVKQEI